MRKDEARLGPDGGSLVLRLGRDEMAQLCAEAAAVGMEPEDYAAQLLAERSREIANTALLAPEWQRRQ